MIPSAPVSVERDFSLADQKPSPHLTGLAIREQQPTFDQQLHLFGLPVGLHNSNVRMPRSVEQQVANFVRHHMAKNLAGGRVPR